MLTDPLVRYYLHQTRRGKNNGIGPVHAAPLFLQRGYGISSFLARLWRADRPVFWNGAKTLVRKTLRTGGDILTDIARSPDENPRDIVSRHVNETAQIWFHPNVLPILTMPFSNIQSWRVIPYDNAMWSGHVQNCTITLPSASGLLPRYMTCHFLGKIKFFALS